MGFSRQENWSCHCLLRSQLLGRLIRSPGPPRRRWGPGALEKEKGVWGSQGEKNKHFFSILLCLSQHNNVSCLKTCFFFTRTSDKSCYLKKYVVGVGLVKVYKVLARLVSGSTLCPPSDVCARSTLCPISYLNKTLLHKNSSMIKPDPWS